MSTIEVVGRESRRVIQGTAGWTPARWRLPAPEGRVDRVAVMRALIQELADLVAEAEGAPRRTVPPPAFETGLGDQLAVMVSDLMAVDPCPRRCEAAISAIRRTHAGLFRT
ncbi:MAG TPA: hypothetical protein H9881_00825 [Candidatus Stackebrandtia excrementipullorum]|nr:hypothetical protein [Candidatus Stackebrandtia excrementipullorum]